MKEDTEGVDAHHVEERVAIILGLVSSGREPGQNADQRNDAQRLLGVVGGDDRIHHHDEDAEDAEHQLRKDPDVVNGRNHRPITCMRA